jgi:hypothetical protein
MKRQVHAEEAKNGEPNNSAFQLVGGSSPNGPRWCLHCCKSFQKGEAWRRYTSPPDPTCNSYSYGIHDCTGRKLDPVQCDGRIFYPQALTALARSCHASVVVVQSIEDRERHNFSSCLLTPIPKNRFWNPLTDPLVRPESVEVLHVISHCPVQLLLTPDQHVIEAFVPHAFQKALTDRIGLPRGLHPNGTVRQKLSR